MNQSYVSPQAGAILANYIDGRFVTGASRFANINPVDGSEINRVVQASHGDVDGAVKAARAALHGDWGRLSALERGTLLRRVADAIERRFDQFVAVEVADTGKSLRQAREIDVPRAAANFRAFADLVSRPAGECFETATADGRGALNYSVRKPLGVVAVIAPWNLPLLLLTWKLAPALAAGNAVIAKPSEETPGTATLLAEVMHEVGMPAGAFNLVHGFGPGSTGEWLAHHKGIDAVTFTGESGTGSAIMRSAADNIKALSFELGGKNAALVFADADFDAAVAGTARSTFTNGGQVCLATERVYVERSIYEPFVAALKECAEGLRIGWPEDPQTDMGPLISSVHRDKVLRYYAAAVADGAEVVTGGGIPHFGDRRDGGAFVEPTILTGLNQQARAVREEIFGPVCHIAAFDSEEQAVALANDSVYGLAATLWTSDLQRGHRVARQMEAGIVWVNTWYLRDLRTPFGGVKLSGVGREGGMHSLNFYSEPMNICIKL